MVSERALTGSIPAPPACKFKNQGRISMNKLLRLRIIEKFDTQRKFANKLGVSESYVSRVIRGNRVLPPIKQDKWALLLDTTPEALGLREYNSNI